MAAQEYYNPRATAAPPAGSPYLRPQSSPPAPQDGHPQGPPPPYQAFPSQHQASYPPPPQQQQQQQQQYSYDGKQSQQHQPPPRQPYYIPHQQQQQQQSPYAQYTPNGGPQQQYFQPHQNPPPAETGSLQRPGSSGYNNGNGQMFSTSPQQHQYSSSPLGRPSQLAASSEVRPHSSSPYPAGRHRRASTPHSTHNRRYSDSRSRSRSRSGEHSRNGSSSRHRHHHHSSKSKDKERGGNLGTFVGAGGGALIGDAIFPGLGTVGGMLLGGYGGHKVDKDKRSRSHSGYQDRYDREWASHDVETREGRRRH